MTGAFKLFPSVLCLLLFLMACSGPDCRNSNPVFNTNAPDSKVYQEELFKQIRAAHPKPLSYWFKRYQKSGEGECMYITVKGDSVCAECKVLVKDWSRLSGIRKTEGMGYAGAELKDLVLLSYQDSLKTDFIFSSVEAIVD